MGSEYCFCMHGSLISDRSQNAQHTSRETSLNITNFLDSSDDVMHCEVLRQLATEMKVYASPFRCISCQESMRNPFALRIQLPFLQTVQERVVVAQFR